MISNLVDFLIADFRLSDFNRTKQTLNNYKIIQSEIT